MDYLCKNIFFRHSKRILNINHDINQVVRLYSIVDYNRHITRMSTLRATAGFLDVISFYSKVKLNQEKYNFYWFVQILQNRKRCRSKYLEKIFSKLKQSISIRSDLFSLIFYGLSVTMRIVHWNLYFHLFFKTAYNQGRELSLFFSLVFCSARKVTQKNIADVLHYH